MRQLEGWRFQVNERAYRVLRQRRFAHDGRTVVELILADDRPRVVEGVVFDRKIAWMDPAELLGGDLLGVSSHGVAVCDYGGSGEELARARVEALFDGMHE